MLFRDRTRGDSQLSLVLSIHWISRRARWRDEIRVIFATIMNPLEAKPHLNGKRCTVTEYAHPVIVSRAWPTKESRGARMEVRKAEITKPVIK